MLLDDGSTDTLAAKAEAVIANANTPEEIWGALISAGFDATEIASLLPRIDRAGAGVATPDASDPRERQAMLLGRLAIEVGSVSSSAHPMTAGRALQANLQESRIAIISATDELGSQLERGLRDVGASPLRDDPLLRGGPDEDQLAHFPNLTDNDLFICATTGGDRTLAEQVNRAALNASKPALYYHVHGIQIVLGPLVLPHRTSCFECFRVRRESALAPWERVLLRTSSDQGALGVCLGLDWLIIDALKHVLHLGEPVTRGRVLTIDYLSGIPEVHTVLRVPRCPVCGPPRQPSVQLWADRGE